MKDDNGKEVRVFSERIPSSTLSKGAGYIFKGFIANLFAPRHIFIQVKTDKTNIILELGGPKGDSKVGTPIKSELKKGIILQKGASE